MSLLARVLRDAPVESRLDLVPAVIAAEHRARLEQKRLEKDYAATRKGQDAQYQEAVEANNARFQELRMYGLYGVGAGFALLIARAGFTTKRSRRIPVPLSSTPVS